MSRSHFSRLFAAFAVLALALVAAGCGGSDDDSGGSGEGAAKEALTVGSDIPYPPFEQGKAPNYEGFDVDLMEAIGENIGREVEFEDTSFDTIFRDLAQGKFDAVASATTITDEREKTVDFTNPYYLSEQAILVKEGGDDRLGRGSERRHRRRPAGHDRAGIRQKNRPKPAKFVPTPRAPTRSPRCGPVPSTPW